MLSKLPIRFRRWLIRNLVGEMQVAINMNVWSDGSLSYGGHGAVCENNHFKQVLTA